MLAVELTPGEEIVVLSGVPFGVATALTCALIRKFRYVGVAVSALVNIASIALSVLADFLISSEWLQFAAWSGIGFAVGALAGFAAAVERGALGKIPKGGRTTAAGDSRMRMIGSAPIPVVPPVSLSGPGAINPEPSIPVGEPHDEGELS